MNDGNMIPEHLKQIMMPKLVVIKIFINKRCLKVNIIPLLKLEAN